MIQVFEPETVKPKGILKLVSQFGWLDLIEANKSGVVQGDLEGAEAKMNGISDPASILGKPSDIFDMYRMNDYIQSASKGAKTVSSQISAEAPNPTE